jgi:hypothetical protein
MRQIIKIMKTTYDPNRIIQKIEIYKEQLMEIDTEEELQNYSSQNPEEFSIEYPLEFTLQSPVLGKNSIKHEIQVQINPNAVQRATGPDQTEQELQQQLEKLQQEFKFISKTKSQEVITHYVTVEAPKTKTIMGISYTSYQRENRPITKTIQIENPEYQKMQTRIQLMQQSIAEYRNLQKQKQQEAYLLKVANSAFEITTNQYEYQYPRTLIYGIQYIAKTSKTPSDSGSKILARSDSSDTLHSNKSNNMECYEEGEKAGVITVSTPELYELKSVKTKVKTKSGKTKQVQRKQWVKTVNKNKIYEMSGPKQMLIKNIINLQNKIKNLQKQYQIMTTPMEKVKQVETIVHQAEEKLKNIIHKVNKNSEKLEQIKQNKETIIRDYKQKANKALDNKIQKLNNLKETISYRMKKQKQQTEYNINKIKRTRDGIERAKQQLSNRSKQLYHQGQQWKAQKQQLYDKLEEQQNTIDYYRRRGPAKEIDKYVKWGEEQEKLYPGSNPTYNYDDEEEGSDNYE